MADIGFIIGNLNKEHGGAQQLLFDICRHLPKSEFDTTVYYLFGEGTFVDAFEDHDTTVVDVAANSNYDLHAFYRLLRSLRSAEHNVLHTNSPISGIWGRPAAKLASISNVVSVEHNVHAGYDRFTRTINGLTLPMSDAIVGVSRSVTNSYFDWERRLFSDSTRLVTIRNGVDVAAIEETFDRTDDVFEDFTPFSPADTIVGTMGRLDEQKGYEYLIRSLRDVKDQNPDAKLLVIGDGPKRSTLEQLAQQTGHSDDIYFTGYVPEVYPFLPAFDVAAFPSLWEGFGLTPVESMVAGCPIVASDIRTFREVIGGAGVLVEPKDESALATAITSLLDDPERRRTLGKNGYKRVIEQFSIERTVKEYADLYRSLSNE